MPCVEKVWIGGDGDMSDRENLVGDEVARLSVIGLARNVLALERISATQRAVAGHGHRNAMGEGRMQRVDRTGQGVVLAPALPAAPLISAEHRAEPVGAGI